MKAKDFRNVAWSGLKGNWGIAIGATLVYALIGGALCWTGVGTLLLNGALMVGIYGVMLSILRGKASFGELFGGFKNFGTNLVAGILHPLFIALWTLLFIVPGIIKTYSYAMTFFILKDHPEMSAKQAITESRKMMDGNKWRLFCLHFSFIGWILLCMLTFGILTIWVIPYMYAADAAFYESLKAERAEAPADAEETPAEETAV